MEREHPELRATIVGVLRELGLEDVEQHRLEHQALRDWIEWRRKCDERREKVFTHIIGWSAVLGIGWLGTVIWDAIRSSIRGGS